MDISSQPMYISIRMEIITGVSLTECLKYLSNILASFMRVMLAHHYKIALSIYDASKTDTSMGRYATIRVAALHGSSDASTRQVSLPLIHALFSI